MHVIAFVLFCKCLVCPYEYYLHVGNIVLYFSAFKSHLQI